MYREELLMARWEPAPSEPTALAPANPRLVSQLETTSTLEAGDTCRVAGAVGIVKDGFRKRSASLKFQ